MGLDSPSLGAIRVNSRRRRGSKRFRPQGIQSSIALETIARFSGSRIRGCRGPEADNQQQADAGLKKRQRQRKKSHGDAGQRRVGKLPHHPLHEGAERRQPHGSVDEDVDPERQAQERIRQAPIQRSIVLRLGHLLGHLRGPLSPSGDLGPSDDPRRPDPHAAASGANRIPPSLAVVRVPSSDRDLLARTRGVRMGAARWTDRLPGAHTGVGDEAGGLLDRRASSDQGPAPTISRKRRLISIAKSVRASEAMLQKP